MYKNIEPLDTIPLPKLLDGPIVIDWLLNGVIPPSTTTIMAGPSGVGKTWLLLDLALSIALGDPWLDQFGVEQGPVLIIDEENSEILLRIRLHKLMELRGIPLDTSLPIHFAIGQMADLSPVVNKRGDVIPSESYKRIYNTIEKINPVLTIFDSLTRVHHNNEMYANEMKLLFGQIKHITNNFISALLFSHHFTKAGREGDGNRIRGSGDIIAAADVTILVEAKGDYIVVTHDKDRYEKKIKPFKVSMKDDETFFTFQGSTKRITKKDVWLWIINKLYGNSLCRSELHEIAAEDVICGARTLDSVINWRVKNGYMEKAKSGREVSYSLSSKAEYDEKVLRDMKAILNRNGRG
jgi:RecA-family ATPase